MIRKSLIPSAILFLLLASCDNPLRQTIDATVNAANRSVITVYPEFASLTPSSEIILSFTKEMNQETLVLGGELGNAKHELFWYSYVIPAYADQPDIYIYEARLTPKTSWPEGETLRLEIQCSDKDGFASVPVVREFGQVSDTLYVAETGDDQNPGTTGSPLRSITEAEHRLSEINLNWTEVPLTGIKVGGGTYPEGGIPHYGSHSLSGSWAADWSSQDRTAYPTIIEAPSSFWSDEINFLLNVLVSPNQPEISNLEFRIRNVDYPAGAILLKDTDAKLFGLKFAAENSLDTTGISSIGWLASEISDCDFSFTNCAASCALNIQASATKQTLIQNCSVQTTGGTSAYGIYVVASDALIQNNTISITSTNSAAGVSMDQSAAVLRNNVFVHTASASSNGGGLIFNASSPLVQNNTIVYNRFGITALFRSNPVLDNNLFVFNRDLAEESGRAAYYAASSDSDPGRLRNNRFSGHNKLYFFADGDGGLGYFDTIPGDDNDLADLEFEINKMNRPASGNSAVDTDERSNFAADWKYTGGALAISQGGLDLSAEYPDFITDRGGNLRTAAWSIGAWEAD